MAVPSTTVTAVHNLGEGFVFSLRKKRGVKKWGKLETTDC
jgi:hypothetical protein